MVVAASLFVPGFATAQTAINIFQRSVALGLVSIGQTFVIIGGSLDLSVAATISTISVITAVLMDNKTENMVWATLAALAMGAVIGAVNGTLVTRFKINAFIATLGSGLILQGILFSNVDNYAGKVPEPFQGLAYAEALGIPLGVFVLIAIVLLAWVILRYTRFGYHLYAVGGNESIARLSGVRTGRVLLGAHILAGIGAALAAIILIARLRAGGPRVGDGFDLDSIAAVVVGGALLSGGRGSVWGTLAGVLIVSVLSTIFNYLDVGAFAQDVIRGVVLIAVVALYSYRARR
ncbi:MAG: ABC transporter permease [Chloroflexi bacterium]|nr:ABC transporter permease [Chloroflexota bacterium]